MDDFALKSIAIICFGIAIGLWIRDIINYKNPKH